MNPAHLLARIAEHGYRLDVTPDGPQLVPVVNGTKLPADLLAQLKRGKAALVAFVTCDSCGRVTTSADDRQRLAGPNPWCDGPKCPYKQRR